MKRVAVNVVVKPLNMDSDEYLTDEGKRKKEDVDELFKRSRRTVRTPTKAEESKDQGEKQMRELMSLMKNLAQDIKEIKTEQRNSNEETKKLQEEIRCLRKEQREFKDEIKELKETNGKAKKEIEDLKKEVERANERMEKMEGEKRRKNIVIQGLRGSSTNPKILKEEMEGFIENALGVSLKVEMARKLREDMCLVELNSKSDKSMVMQNKNKLRNLSEKVYINDDLTQNERKIQNIIRRQAKEEVAKGKTVKVGYQKMICDQEVWTWNGKSGKLEKHDNKQNDQEQTRAKNQ